MKTKKLLGIVCVLALFVCVFASLSIANAQECVWDLYVDGVKYSPTADYAKNGSLTFDGTTAKLNNFSGKSLAAIPGGLYDDDAPYLVLQLSGTNSLTGNYISEDKVYTLKPSGGTYWKGALYAQPRQGGSGSNSRIRILGSGTLNIDIRSSVQSGVNQKAVVCDNFDVAGNSIVNIKYGGEAILNSSIYAIDAYEANVRTNYGTSSNSILDIKAYANPYLDTRTGTATPSKCDVYGVTGTVNVQTTNYFSIDNYTLTTGKTGYTCKNALIQAGSAAYFKTPASLGSYTDIMLNVNDTLLQSQFTNSKFGYLAITPKTPNAASSLKPVSWMKVTENAPYPKYGDAKPASVGFTDLTSTANCYLKLTGKILPNGYGVGESDVFDKFADKPFSFYHEVVPAKGYYVKQATPSVSEIKYYTTYPISLVNDNTLKLIYGYSKPTTKLNKTVICSTHNKSNNNICINAGGEDKQCTYLWKYDKYLKGGVIGGCDIEGINSPYGQAMGGITKYQLSIRGDWMDYCFYDDYDAQELNGIGLYCEIVSMPSGAKSVTEECYYSWDHDYVYKTDMAQHVKTCADSECNYKNESTRANHVDANNDGKCDVCRQEGLAVITQNPKGVTVDAKTEFTFDVKATGYNLKYEWHRITALGADKVVSPSSAGVTITDGKFTFKPIDSETNCIYNGNTFYCVVSNIYGSVTSEKVVLTVSHVKDLDIPVETTADSHSYTCYCGEEISEPHSFDDGNEIVPADCTTNGEIEYTCKVCEYTKTKTIDASGHTPVAMSSVAATCTIDGQKGGKICSVCNVELEKATVIKAPGHKVVTLAAKAATCKATGLTEGKKCSVCNEILVAQKSVAKKTDHSYKNVVTTKATLSKDGKLTPTCSVCGAKKSATTIAYIKTITLSSTKPTYTGKAIKPTVTVKDNKGKVVDAKYYTITYSNNTNVGKATVKVTFKTNYSGSKTLNFTIVPKQVTGLKASSVKTTSLKLTWTKAAGAKNYKVEWSTDGKKWTVVTTTTGTSCTVQKLKAGTKYQFRVTALDSTKKIAGKVSAILKTGTLTSAPTIKLASSKSKTATVTITKVTGASKYTVYKSTDNKKWTKVGDTTKLTYNLTKLTGGKKIYVKVVAVNAYGNASAYSSVKNVTVKK